jgi:hypothetical protein
MPKSEHILFIIRKERQEVCVRVTVSHFPLSLFYSLRGRAFMLKDIHCAFYSGWLFAAQLFSKSHLDSIHEEYAVAVSFR